MKKSIFINFSLLSDFLFLGHNNKNMAQKLSINQQFSETPSESLSFKNKRRRKLHLSSSIVTCNSLETDKSSKHRWRLNGNGSKETIFDECCMTDTRECFDQQFPPSNKPHDACEVVRKSHQTNNEGVKSCVNNRHHSIIKAKSISRKQTRARDGAKVEKTKPLLRDIVNCRKLLDWTTASSVRKLLPIFILVNMLPFLYAGESS